MTGVRGQETGDTKVGAELVRPAVVFILAAALLVPIFAHGCHGDDVDHEPVVAPPYHQSHPETPP